MRTVTSLCKQRTFPQQHQKSNKKQYPKENEKRRWETCRRRAGEIASFFSQNIERNESITLQSKSSLYVFGELMERLRILRKFMLSRPWTFDNDFNHCRSLTRHEFLKDFVSFRTSTDSSNSKVFIDVKLSLVNSQWRIKKLVFWYDLRYNHDFDLQLVKFHKVCLDI